MHRYAKPAVKVSYIDKRQIWDFFWTLRSSHTESLPVYSTNATFKTHLLPRTHLTPQCFRLCFCTRTVTKGIKPIVWHTRYSIIYIIGLLFPRRLHGSPGELWAHYGFPLAALCWKPLLIFHWFGTPALCTSLRLLSPPLDVWADLLRACNYFNKLKKKRYPSTYRLKLSFCLPADSRMCIISSSGFNTLFRIYYYFEFLKKLNIFVAPL